MENVFLFRINVVNLRQISIPMAKKTEEAKKTAKKAKSSTSAKKREKVILQNLPAEAKWLKQPTSITFLNQDMTLTQVGTMVEIVDVLQDRIKQAIAKRERTLFDESEFSSDGTLDIEVQLSAIYPDATQYRNLEDTTKSMLKWNVQKEYVDEKGESRKVMQNIFSSIDIPTSENGRRKGTVRFSILKNAVDSVFVLDQYNKYLKSISRSANSVYTSRIYMFITAYLNLGKWEPKYEDLHRMFGFTVFKTDETTKKQDWVVEKYPNYRQFKQKVLKVAQEELKTLAEENKVDCFFDFYEIYPNGKKNGQPYKIHFDIYRTSFGRHQQEADASMKEYFAIESMLKNEFAFGSTEINQLRKLMKAEDYPFLKIKISEVKLYIDSHADSIKDPKRYAFTSLRQALLDLVPEAEVEMTAGTQQPPVDAELTNAEGQGSVNVEQTTNEVAADTLALFNKAKQNILDAGHDPEEFTSGMTLVGEDAKTLIIQVGSQSFIDAYINMHGTEFFDVLKSLTGKSVKFVKQS